MIQTRLVKIFNDKQLDRDVAAANVEGFRTVGVIPGMVFMERETMDPEPREDVLTIHTQDGSFQMKRGTE